MKAIYGFEWQGDNLLLAREAVLFSVIAYYREKFKRTLPEKSLKYFAYIISWNIWQMDGLKMVIPYSCHEETSNQPSLSNRKDTPQIVWRFLVCQILDTQRSFMDAVLSGPGTRRRDLLYCSCIPFCQAREILI